MYHHSGSMGFTEPSGMADTYAVGICTDNSIQIFNQTGFVNI
jgi:hypothetical protein